MNDIYKEVKNNEPNNQLCSLLEVNILQYWEIIQDSFT
ncbi:hypothetical protein GGR31_002981 [Mesonia maritima]|uniref:Uncharacterized protein n=1 Tax=Mesonia maritima TaxID=1793873 RepID=A0ABU1KAH8_9FLAO|nr:hypothetical protein [Mesonia maritima]